MITEIQKKTAQAVVNIFETGKPLGDYGQVTVAPGDPGHLTYGRSQTTLASGNLALLLHSYCETSGKYAESLASFLPAFDRRDLGLDENEKVKSLLWLAGQDPTMQKVQNSFFDRVYWEPSVREYENIQASLPLSVTVIYDSKIHGSYQKIKGMTMDQYGTLKGMGEKEWISKYISVRKGWLENHRNSLIRKTVYRMNALGALITQDKWNLELPLLVRNVVIDEELFKESYCPPIIAAAPEKTDRVLYLTAPRMKGGDVRDLQKRLGFSKAEIDGIFGLNTDKAVRSFQEREGLKIDGKVGPVTKAALAKAIGGGNYGS